jgi:hypothetical protein
MMRRAGIIGSVCGVLLLPAAATQASAQGAGGSGPGLEPTDWLAGWSPLRVTGTLFRTVPGATLTMPDLLTSPAPGVGLFWNAGNPAALAGAVDGAWSMYRLRHESAAGTYRRPFDADTETRNGFRAEGWTGGGTRAAAIGRVVVDRTGFAAPYFANVMDPFGMSPMLVADTTGTDVNRTTARVEGAGAVTLGPVALGASLGFEAGESRTVAAPVPRLLRSSLPGATLGAVLDVPGVRALSLGTHVRWQRPLQRVSLISIAAPNRVYQLAGYGEEGATDLVNVNYRRDIERNVVAGGGGLALRGGGARLAVFGEVIRSDDRHSSAESNDPLTDRWDADGATIGVAAGWAILQGRLEVLGILRSTSFSGELVLHQEDDLVAFTADERRLETALDARLRPGPGWLVAVRLGAENETRDRFDALNGMRLDLESWRSQFAAEVARDLGPSFSLAIGAAYEMYRAGGNVPAGPAAGYVYRTWLGPEFAYYGTDANSAAASATARWSPRQDGAGVFLQVRTATLSAAGTGGLPLKPEGSRTGFVLLLGATY